jgi:chromosome segregation ATPase
MADGIRPGQACAATYDAGVSRTETPGRREIYRRFQKGRATVNTNELLERLQERAEISNPDGSSTEQQELLRQAWLALESAAAELTRLTAEVAELRASLAEAREAIDMERDYRRAAWNTHQLISDRASVAERERDAALAEVERVKRDKERLDFLDRLNASLNKSFGSTYGWTIIVNHNVNRLVLGGLIVDLNDMEAHGLPSCRKAIDEFISRAALTPREPDNA